MYDDLRMDIKLNFVINDPFIASYIIARNKKEDYIEYAIEKYQTDLIKFLDAAWEKSNSLWEIVNSRENLYTTFPKFNLQNYSEVGEKLDNFINEVVNTPEYKILRVQTEASIVECQNEWDKNYKETSAYINSLGIKISGEFNVWMTHPGLKCGAYLGNNNLRWAYQTYWANYNTIYLWHEILHSYLGHTQYEHVLIEFITDDQMRSILNGDKYPPFEGHGFLREFKVEVLPIWQKYLASDNKYIKNLVAEFKSAYEVFSEKQ